MAEVYMASIPESEEREMIEIKVGQIWKDVVRGGMVEIIEVKRWIAGDEHVCFKIIAELAACRKIGQIIERYNPDSFRTEHRLVEPEKCAETDYEALYEAACRDKCNRRMALRCIRRLISEATLCDISSVRQEICEIVDRALGE